MTGTPSAGQLAALAKMRMAVASLPPIVEKANKNLKAAVDRMQNPILRYPDPRLREVSTVVARDERALAIEIVRDLKRALEAHPEGVGISAPQIGVLKRVILLRPYTALQAFINPVIEATDGPEITTNEGCLSIPSYSDGVTRPETVDVSWIDLDGNPQRQDFSGLVARVIQHEIDHLDGVLFIDRLPRQAWRRFVRKYGVSA